MTTGPDQNTPTGDTGEKKKTESGLEPKVAGLLCYLAWWITGIVFLLIEKDDKFVRFHAIQSSCVFGAFSVALIALGILQMIFSLADVPVIPTLLWLVGVLLWIAAVILWIVCMYKAYQEEEFELPIAGKFAKEHR